MKSLFLYYLYLKGSHTGNKKRENKKAGKDK